MNNLEQAYIEGFVKRAAEHGVNEVQAARLLERQIAELEKRRANPALNAIFNGGITGLIHDAVTDSGRPSEAPSRLGKIWAPGFIGGVGGAMLGRLTRNPSMARLGALLGGGAGSAFGAKDYNSALDKSIEKLRNK